MMTPEVVIGGLFLVLFGTAGIMSNVNVIIASNKLNESDMDKLAEQDLF
jgi:xanthine/uracil permease